MASTFAFIGGLHRSGTSPLHRLLATHPDVSTFEGTGVPEDEGQHLQSLIPPARAFGGPGSFGRHPSAHLTELDRRCSPESAERLLDEWMPHWDASKPVKVEKSPPNIIRFRFLQGLFPGALAIVVIRHPLAVALATSKWARFTSLSKLVEHWCIVHETFAADLPLVRPLLVIHYEDLSRDPDVVAGRLASHLGLTPEFVTSEIRPDGNRRYADLWDARTARSSTRRERDRILRRYGDRVLRLGYRLDDLGAPPLPAPWSASR